jgi:hypothetical protein
MYSVEPSRDGGPDRVEMGSGCTTAVVQSAGSLEQKEVWRALRAVRHHACRSPTIVVWTVVA